MIQLYKNAHIFVLPSALENSPNSLAEALTMGVPCIASDVGGVSSMVKHGEDCYLYQHNDPVMLAEYICRLFKSEKLCKKLSENGRKTAKSQFECKKNNEELFNIYNKICKE